MLTQTLMATHTAQFLLGIAYYIGSEHPYYGRFCAFYHTRNNNNNHNLLFFCFPKTISNVMLQFS